MKKLFSSISLAFCTLSSMVMYGTTKQDNEEEARIKKSKSYDELTPLRKRKPRKKKKHVRSITNGININNGITLNDVTDIVEDEVEVQKIRIDELTKEVDTLRESIVNISENIMEISERELPEEENFLEEAKELLQKTDDMNEEIDRLRNALSVHENRLNGMQQEPQVHEEPSLLNKSTALQGSLIGSLGLYAATSRGGKNKSRNKTQKGAKKRVSKNNKASS